MGKVTENKDASGDLCGPYAMKKKYVYSKDFLLSLADLDICKRAPEKLLDHALLRDDSSELVDGGVAIPAAASRNLIRGNRESDAHSESPPEIPEWRRLTSNPGSSFLQQGSRQADNYSSSKQGPGRGENVSSRNTERSGQNRWEPRGNGGDREREKNRARREWDSTESGSRVQSGAFPRSAVVAQEHDGLLGSGGPLVQRNMAQTRAHDRHNTSGRTSRMSRPNEQYQPVRGGKTTHHTRREETDSINDETFGSEEWSNEERAEQERRRRDSFEQMRKEQRKKSGELPRKQDDNWMWDGGQSNEVLLSSSPGTPHSSSSKDDTFKTQSRPVSAVSTPRLPVPPGFSKPALQKKEIVEVSKTLSSIENEILKQVSLSDGIEQETKDDISTAVRDNPQSIEPNDETSLQPQVPLASKFARWFPIQEGSSQETNDNSSPIPKADNSDSVWSMENKYFAEEFSINESASVKSVNLFSNSGNFLHNRSSFIDKFDLGRHPCLDDKSGSVASLMNDAKSQGSILPMPDGPSLEDVERGMTAGASTTLMANSISNVPTNNQDTATNAVLMDRLMSPTHDPGLIYNTKKDISSSSVPLDTLLSSDIADSNRNTETLRMQKPLFKGPSQLKVAPVFLTCEDLEQSLLADTATPVEKHSSSLLDDLQQGASKNVQKGLYGKSTAHNIVQNDADYHIAGNASQHIMSLLHSKDASKPAYSDAIDGFTTADPAIRYGHKTPEETYGQASEVISVESLFGKAFTNELRSLGEPVSSKVMDDPVNAASLPQLSRKSGHVNTAKGGWGSKFPQADVFFERELVNSLEHDVRNGMWPEIASRAHVQPENLNDFEKTASSMGVRPFLNDFGQPNIPPFLHPSHHESHYLPTPHLQPHGQPLDRVRDPHFVHDGVGMYPPNGPLHPGEGVNFIQSGRSQFGEHLDGHSVKTTPKMPAAFDSAYLESVQMLNHHMPGHTVGTLGIHPSDNKWFSGDPGHGSQGIPGFGQYPNIIPDRQADYGAFGLGGNGHTMGPPLDKLSYLERMQFPYGPGFDGYVHPLPDYRPRYG